MEAFWEFQQTLPDLCQHAHTILSEALLGVAQARIVDQDVQAAWALQDGLCKGLDTLL